jgi:hypothetical protein
MVVMDEDEASGLPTRAARMNARCARAGWLAAALLFAVCGQAAALDRRVRIVNDSRYDIVALYGVHVDAGGWQESLLGEDILPADSSVVLNFDDGSGYCRYRLRAVFDDGVELVRSSVNVCEVGTYRYTD